MRAKTWTKVLIAAGSLFALNAFAQSPHFVGTPKTSCSGTDLTVSFKIAGLGNDPATVQLSASSATTYCVNHGENLPPGQSEGVTPDEGTFYPNRNGQASGGLTLEADVSCPDKMKPVATYQDVVLTLENTGEKVELGDITCP